MAEHDGALRRKLTQVFEPLTKSWRAVAICAVGLGLLLLHLHQGQRAFFIAQLAPDLLPGASPEELGWWAAIYQHAVAFVLFLLVPLALFKCLAREKLSDLGLGLGDWRFGFGLVVPLGLLGIALPAGLSAGSMPDFVAEYPLAELAGRDLGHFALYQLAYGLLYYTAYEAFFRGFVQFGLRPHIGALGAILVQTSMTTLLHLGKPQAEIWSALMAGFLFGALAFRLRSIWPLFIVHWGLGLATDFFCARAAGSGL